ncbi:hypothetical protein LTS10_003930 [Elasticomyces elasticus]|nr:hypothetical protein LTS10_003930 [Elasticomyces elasticus]
MAHTLTLGEGQLQQLLRMTVAENERLLSEVQTLQGVIQPMRDEIDTLKAENEALKVESRTPKAQEPKSEDRLTSAYPVHHVAPFSRTEPTHHAINSTHATHGAPTHRGLKREVIEIESEDESVKQEPRKQRKESTDSLSNDEATMRDVGSAASGFSRSNASLGTSKAESITTDMMDVADLRTDGPEMQRNSDAEQAARTTVIAFHDAGDIYVLEGKQEPQGLRDLITLVEEHVAEAFKNNPTFKGHPDWKVTAQGTIQCIRQFCSNGTSYRSIENTNYASCQRCFNARRPCLRFDADHPSRGIHAVPLPAATRSGLSHNELAYYIYPRPKAQTQVEKAGKIWAARPNSKVV